MKKLLRKKLPRDFYNRKTVTVARELLGKVLVHTEGKVTRIGRIVEVEAYIGPHDLASHSSKGITPRTKVMHGPPGYAYVYLIYGIYYCVNIVTEKEGYGSAVLLRALEPIQNITEKTKGPGLLCKAMHIDKRLHGHDMLSDDFFIAEDALSKPFSIVRRPRHGVDYAKEWAAKLLRFYIKGNPFVSRR